MTLSPTSSRGAAAIQTRETFFSGQTIPVDAATAIAWDTSPSGDNLLNISTPTAPTVITAGVYAISALLTASAAVALQQMSFYLEMDQAGDDANVSTIIPLQSDVVGITPQGSLALCWYVPAGGIVASFVKHHVVAGVDVSFFAQVQRLS